MTNRERILAVVQGRMPDRVPFVQYSGLAAPNDEVWQHVGRDAVGILRWSSVHALLYPHCKSESQDFETDGQRRRRTTIHTPGGSIFEERIFEPVYHSSSVCKHYVETPADLDVFIAYCQDAVVEPRLERYHQAAAELGDDGLPLITVERTPYQQLWVQWAGLDNLTYLMADCTDRVQLVMDLLAARARRIYEIASQSDAPFIDVPDNITAPTIGPRLFEQHCVPRYNELADMLGERPVFVHMDGDLRPLWDAISASKVRGIDSLAPPPDNDTSVADAVAMWPETRLFVNFPSSVHLRPAEQVYEQAMELLTQGGHTGRLQIQISENVPRDRWRVSFPAIAKAVQDFGRPA